MDVERIDKYEVVDTLGRGSMGVVYRAKDPVIGRTVAIKTLKSIYLGSDDDEGNEAMQRFRQESRSAGMLHHPNIVTIFEAGRTDNGSPYIVMEFIEGTSLEKIISDRGAMDPLEALHYVGQIASAIDYAHSQDVIHRDIKPSNVLIDSNFRPYLLDFGIAKLSDTSLTPAGTVVGTPSYMSPEQIRGESLDGRTDVFSLSVLTFELIAGERPFHGSDFTTVVSNIIHKEPKAFDEIGLELPKSFELALRKGISKDRDSRYRNALEFVDALGREVSITVGSNGVAGGYNSNLKLVDVLSEKGIDLKSLNQDVDETVLASSGSGLQIHNGAGESAPRELAKTLEQEVPKDLPRDQKKEGRKGKSLFWPVLGVTLGVGLISAGLLYQDLQDQSDTELVVEDEAVEPVVVETSEPESVVTTTVTTTVPTTELKVEPDLPSLPSDLQLVAVPKLEDRLLKQLLRESDREVLFLQEGLKEAGKRGAEEYIAEIIALSSHSDYLVRIAALKAMNKSDVVKSDEGFEAIGARLDDSEFLVRGFAVRALAARSDEKTLELIRARLSKEQNEVVKKLLKRSALKIEKSLGTGG